MTSRGITILFFNGCEKEKLSHIVNSRIRPTLRLYGHESLTSTFTQAFVARRWQSLHFEAETAVAFYPENFQQAAGLVNYYNTENWTALQVTYDEELGRILELTICDNFSFSQIPMQCRFCANLLC